MKAAIIGLGVVGRAQERMFGPWYELVTYDPAVHGDDYPDADLARCEFAVVCVGTPAGADGSADLTALNDAVARLPDIPLLIRSTVPPGTTDLIAATRRRVAAFCPEFMHERDGGRWAESGNVPFMLLGGSPEACAFFIRVMQRAYLGLIYECTALEAELAKYVANMHWAVKVTFVNEMANVARAFGADWENVSRAWRMDMRVSRDYTSMKGFPPGFGGRCWPKDLQAIVLASEKAGYEPWFLKAVAVANERFQAG